MTTSLQEICYGSIADTIMSTPPIIQKQIIKTTKKRIKKKVRKEVENEITTQRIEIFDIIPDIMEDLVRIITTPGAVREDYCAKFPEFHPTLVMAAVDMAEETIRRMDQRWVSAAFRLANYNIDYDDEISSVSDEPDSEDMY